jgi:hypothetical protein
MSSVTVGSYSTGNGAYSISSGTINGSSSSTINVGSYGTGLMQQTGGVVAAGSLNLGFGSSGSGTVAHTRSALAH